MLLFGRTDKSIDYYTHCTNDGGTGDPWTRDARRQISATVLPETATQTISSGVSGGGRTNRPETNETRVRDK